MGMKTGRVKEKLHGIDVNPKFHTADVSVREEIKPCVVVAYDCGLGTWEEPHSILAENQPGCQQPVSF